MKIPKTLGQCADLLYITRNKRLAKQKEADTLEGQEKELKEYIIATLPKSKASGIAGKLARVEVKGKEVPTVKDWEKFHGYMLKQKAPELMQKRINTDAVLERLENGETIPGVEMFKALTVSITKR